MPTAQLQQQRPSEHRVEGPGSHRGRGCASGGGSVSANLMLQARSRPVLDEVRDIGTDAAVGECGVLFRDGRRDVLPLGLGKTKSEAVNELSDSGIRGQWGHAAILRPPLACVNDSSGGTRPRTSSGRPSVAHFRARWTHAGEGVRSWCDRPGHRRLRWPAIRHRHE
jgi:hypothetical protein